ncbi:MAG TPA: hypothetical protein PK402_04350 [Tepidisphaeraceae bacterium]|nr:hypothetical protein [Tepidisphaeraceae bacterium]
MHDINNISFRGAEARIATAIAAAANSTRRALGGAFGENFRSDLRGLEVDGFVGPIDIDPSVTDRRTATEVMLAAPAMQSKLGHSASTRQVV